MRYTINIDRKVKIWVNEEVEVDFDGTEAELKELLEKHGGNIHAVEEFKDLVYLGSEYITETEEHIDPEEGNAGFETYEVREIESDGEKEA